jgi:S2P endopeptidase
LLKYLIAFNGAIAILNLVPCYALDGQHILSAVLLVGNSNRFIDSNESEPHQKAYLFLMTFGTLLLTLNLVLALYSLFF